MKPETHKTITRLAIEVCKNRISSNIYENSSYIIQGTEEEDTTELIKRAKNWHFYRANNSKIPQFYRKLKLKFKTTSEDILEERIDEMSMVDKHSSEYYKKLGRILHHIQDMSTPSHVLPIYHGPKFPLQLTLGSIDDFFETFMVNNDDKITFNDTCKNISIDGINSYYDIYKHAAEDMLKNILKVNEPIENRPYSLFWKHHTEQESDKIKSFGAYGECHNYFEKLPLNNSYSIKAEYLLDIQEKITTHAIVNTCKALLYTNK